MLQVVSVAKTGRRKGQYGTLVGNLNTKTNKVFHLRVESTRFLAE